MTDQEILDAFVRPVEFPQAALALAMERRETIAPLLIEEIAAWAEGRHAPAEGHYYLADIALHLLAEWRETSVFKFVLALLRRPDHEMLRDTLLDNGHQLLARLYDGDAAALTALMLDESADEFMRSVVFDAYVLLVCADAIPRAAAHAFLVQAFADMPHSPSFAWTGWTGAVTALQFEDLVPQAMQLFAEEAIDPVWLSPEDFALDMEEARAGDPYVARHPFTSAADIISNWEYPSPEDLEDNAEDFASPSVQVINRFRGIGRNDPCPCGSGKKFKKCCLEKAQAGLL